MTVKCPKCSRSIDVTGMPVGATVTCKCGNVVEVPKAKKPPYALIAIGLVLLACPCIGIVAAIAIPNFIRFQARAKQTECNINLKSFYVAQRASESAEADLSKIGFSPERGNRYAYFVGPGPMEERSSMQTTVAQGTTGIGVDTFKFPTARPITFQDLPPDVAAQVGIKGECPDCSITMACAGDIDNVASDQPDVWTISTQDRVMPDGTRVAAGEPYNHVNDITSD
jgi:type IV pilus assembly protein PilA